MGRRGADCQNARVLATRTFLFSDLRDYTQFVQRHGDGAATQLITDYRRIVRAEIAKHEGAEIKTEGDSFYVVFPGAHAAVSAASAILREADRYSRRQPERPLRIGIGIHAGEPTPHEGQYVGSAVIVAARLAQSAGAGDLLVSDLVRGLLPRDGMPVMEERTGLALKGLDDPPRVYAVRWPRDAAAREPTAAMSIPAVEPGSRQVLCPEVVGRGRELASLETFLAEALAGTGRTVLLAGEAGLGKSALLRLFSDAVRAGGTTLLTGECTEIEARRPFGPFIDALSSAGIPLPPELGQGGPGAQPVAETERYRVHAAFAERLAAAAAQRPLVLTVEDLHWGDEATYELVPYLARKLRDRPVLLLATYRSDELHRTHPFNHVLAELARGRLAEEVRLRTLSTAELADMVRLTLGLSRPPTREFVDALYARTEGNPFFVEEILRALVERGDLEYREGAWRRTKEVADLTIPVSVRDAVQQRLLAMPASARRVLQVAAVIGQRFEFELAREVAQVSEEDAFEGIRTGIDGQLLFEEEEAEGERYRFRHALSREAVLADLLQRERRLLHRAVGEAIERASPGAVEELAYHFDEARDPRAYRYHSLAAETAARSYAYGRSTHHLERAIELAPDDDPALGPLLLRLADAAFASGDLSRAERAAEEAGAAFTAAGDEVGRGAAATRQAMIRWQFGDTEQARAIVQDAIRTLESLGDDVALAGALSELGRIQAISAQPDAVTILERSVAMARRFGAAEIEAHAIVSLGTALSYEGDAKGVEMIRRGLAMGLDNGFVAAAARAYNNLSLSLMVHDAPQNEIDEVMDAAVAHATRYGYRSHTLALRETARAVFALDWDRALALADEADTDTAWGASHALMGDLIRIHRAGPEAALLAHAEQTARRLRAFSERQFRSEALLLAAIYASTGAHGPAVELVEVEPDLVGGRSLGGWVSVVAAAVLTSAFELADSDRLARWQRHIAEIAGKPTMDRLVAATLFAGALVARLEGREGDALAALRAVVPAADRPQHFYVRSLSHQHAAEILAGRGDPQGASLEYAAAREPWERAGATWYLGQLDARARERGIPVD